MIELLVATDNPGKLREYRQLLSGLPLTVVSPAEKKVRLDVAEVGGTFAENAALKAVAYARASDLLTLADDSGLEVDALGGEPGVRSARYAGPAADDACRVAFLLNKLRDVPWAERTARFRCAIAVTRAEGHVFLAEGTCPGYIAFAPEGRHGFGYDPVFYLPDLGKTMAQLPADAKNRLSHRAAAVQAARPTLARLADP